MSNEIYNDKSIYINIYDDNYCIICHDNKGVLCSNICLCKNIKYHKECLYRWISIKDCYICEICDTEYKTEFIEEFIVDNINIIKRDENNNKITIIRMILSVIVFFIVVVLLSLLLYR